MKGNKVLKLVLITNLPFSYRNADQMKAYWKISSISEKSENGGKLNSLVLLFYTEKF